MPDQTSGHKSTAQPGAAHVPPPPPPPSSLDAQTRAVVTAAEALTKQVRRIADALTTPVVEYEVTTDDGPKTTVDAIVSEANRRFIDGTLPDAEAPAARPPHVPDHTAVDDCPGCEWELRPAAAQRRTHPGLTRAEGDEDAQRTTRRESLRNLIDRLDRNGALDFREGALLRQHVEAEIREVDTARAVAAGNKRHVQIMYADLTQAQREREQAEAARAEEERLRLTLAAERDRWEERSETADRIRAEAQRDRDQHAAVLREVLATFVHKVDGYRVPRVRSGEVDVVTLDKWRSVVAPTVERPWWVTVAEVRAELEEEHEMRTNLGREVEGWAQLAGQHQRWGQRRWNAWKSARRRAREARAAIEYVRTLVAGTANTTSAGISDYDIGRHDLARAVLAALDGPEQPTETAAKCTATIGDEDAPDDPVRCIAPAGHYDETREPVPGPNCNPGGWHTNGRGHMWTDRAATAIPHREQPTTEPS